MVLEEVREFQATVLVATLTGFLLGGLVGARYAGDKFVAISHSSKFSSTMQAQVCTAYVYTMFVCIFIHMQCFPQDKRRGGGGGGAPPIPPLGITLIGVYKTETKSCQNNFKPRYTIMYFHSRLMYM